VVACDHVRPHQRSNSPRSFENQAIRLVGKRYARPVNLAVVHESHPRCDLINPDACKLRATLRHWEAVAARSARLESACNQPIDHNVGD